MCERVLQCLIRLQSQKNKTSGHTETIWSWRIIDFRPKWIGAQRRHKQGNIQHVQACAVSQSRTRSTWCEEASHNVLFLHSSNMVCWLLLARLVMLFSTVNTENTCDIYYDGVLWITPKRIQFKYKQNWTYRTRCHTILIPPYIVYIRYGAVLTSGASSMKPVLVSHSVRSLLIRMLMLWVNICSSDLQ